MSEANTSNRLILPDFWLGAANPPLATIIAF